MRLDTHVAGRIVGAAVLACALSMGSAAQELAVQNGSAAPPAELAEPVRAQLADASTMVTRGENTLEFWWVKAVPLDAASSGGAAWAGVPAGSLVGALRLAKTMTDIRGATVKPGVYTLRFALQPQDGDHTGVSPYREFLLVAPAADDTTADPVGHKGAIALAKKTLGKSHPAALSLDPPAATEAPGTVVTNDAGHEAVVFQVPATRGGAAAGQLTFGLILVGTIEHQM